jgi:lantibiotic transport system ATP-binding protein
MTNCVIQTQGLTRKFGNLTAVDDLSLSVPDGSVFGFLGPNGAGKTTTIRMILGLIKPHRGSTSLFGRAALKPSPSALRYIGAMVESPSLYDHLTGKENMDLTRRLLGVEKSWVDETLKTVGMENASGRRAGSYSTGMRQRLGLALALLHKPKLLILDEPTSGLDPAGIHEFRHLIKSFPRELGITVFLSSHLLSEVEQIATHIGIINRGRLLFQGPLNELKTNLQSSVEMEVSDPEKAMAVINNSRVLRKGDVLTLPAKGKEDIAKINKQLVSAGIGVYGLTLRRPDLENIFLSLTKNVKGDSQ